jgi:hypothetical protein
MKQASTYLTAEELAQLDRQARARGISRAALLHELVTEYLQRRATKPLPVPKFDFEPVGPEERRKIIDDAYGRRADRR